ncbi:MAG: hypothetical protein R3B72_12225 [Polyangiaceae bacterium]
MADLGQVLADLVGLFEGMPNWNHPLTMVNVVPPSNVAATVASMMTQVFDVDEVSMRAVVDLVRAARDEVLADPDWEQTVVGVTSEGGAASLRRELRRLQVGGAGRQSAERSEQRGPATSRPRR